MSSNKRYYWLKLNENFFDREEIKVIENMPNGKDYIIFYMKLLLKSIKSEGRLLFRDVIPYTPDMLSAITGTDIDTVKVSIDLFAKLGLMEIWDDGTLFMAETQNMIGSETDSARRMRRMRAKEKQKELPAPSPKTNAERQRKYRAKQSCKGVQHIPFIEDYADNKRYGGNYYIVIKRDKFRCSICGDIENLCVHHIDGYDELKPENNAENKLITLCRKCHSNIHSGEPIPQELLESIDYFYNDSNDNEKCDKDVKESDTDIEIDIEIEKDIDKDTTKEPPAPYETIKDLYNSICKDLSKVRSISSSRKRHLKARWKQFEYNLGTFEECFKKVQASDFCTGENERGWKADFDWLIKNDNNMVKVLEGKYDNKNGGKPIGGNFKQDDDIYAGIGFSHEELQEL